MVKKKIDNRIRIMIENGVKMRHRTMFVLIGDKSRDQVPILYDMLTKASVKAKPTILWCYKNKDDAISNHGKKRAKKIQAGKIDINEADLFDTFRVSTTIHGRYYKDTHTILGKTYGVCVLQDFEALTPNILARTIETVEGGGLIILLIKSITSLKQIYTINMDIHKKLKTESHQNVTCRFNERLILSLSDCERCLLLNDDLTVLPLSAKTAIVKPVEVNELSSPGAKQLSEMKEQLQETPLASALVNLCKTYDQAKAVTQFIDALAEKQLKPPTTLTAARGRGKSAALGLALAAAVGFNYSNIYVTSPTPENLITLFEFTLKGFDAFEYQEHVDYSIIRSTNPDFNKSIIRINVTRNSRQTIQYISPSDAHSMLNAADLLVIDEAAAIPLPLVKSMLGPYLIFMASTINGYEGTGRSLSIKLISQLQKDNNAPVPIKLDESIRYNANDSIELWLTSLLCLDTTNVQQIHSGCPPPDTCELYYINRDTLFSYHKAAEAFLQRIISICVSSHYKNSPNDLQIMSDAPAHHIFCLLGPITKKDQLPEILVVVQICLEGQISSQSIQNSLSRGMKNAGDLIPWNLFEQYGDQEFAKLSGARIVRIATHPNYQRMGYGKKAVELLTNYYEGKIACVSETIEDIQNDVHCPNVVDEGGLLKEIIEPRKTVPTLLKRLNERKPEHLDYLGTSFGLTSDLLRFWKGLRFVPVYLSQKENDLTGEHSSILILSLNPNDSNIIKTNDWLKMYFIDFRRRLLKLLAKAFQKFPTGLALSLLDNKVVHADMEELQISTLNEYFLSHDIQRLEMYIRNQVEYKLIMDLTTDLAQLYFQSKLDGVRIDTIQKAVLLGIGLQNKNIENISEELNMPAGQILAKFYDGVKKITKYLTKIVEKEYDINTSNNHEKSNVEDLKSIDDDLANEENAIKECQTKKLNKLKKEFHKFAIKGENDNWKMTRNYDRFTSNEEVNGGPTKRKKKQNEGNKKQKIK